MYWSYAVVTLLPVIVADSGVVEERLCDGCKQRSLDLPDHDCLSLLQLDTTIQRVGAKDKDMRQALDVEPRAAELGQESMAIKAMRQLAWSAKPDVGLVPDAAAPGRAKVKTTQIQPSGVAMASLVSAMLLTGIFFSLRWALRMISPAEAAGAPAEKVFEEKMGNGDESAGTMPDSARSQAATVSTCEKITRGLFVGGLHIVTSAMMILLNKTLMAEERFPFAIPLTTLHMGFSFFSCNIIRAIRPELFTSADSIIKETVKGSSETSGRTSYAYVFKFGLVGSGMACSIVTSNIAYEFADVSLLQMIKEATVLPIYLLAVLWGQDVLKMRNLLILCLVVCFSVFAVHGATKPQPLGVIIQVFSCSCQALQAVVTSDLMSSFGGPKVDPLGMVMLTAPVVLILLIPFNYLYWDPLIMERFHMWKELIVLSGLVACALQVVNAMTIRQLSAVGLGLAATTKDLSVVIGAALILHETVTRTQIVGFSGAVFGIGLYSAVKVFPSMFEFADAKSPEQ
jgi:drug/metabolite transporter (DMT)-like permease